MSEDTTNEDLIENAEEGQSCEGPIQLPTQDATEPPVTQPQEATVHPLYPHGKPADDVVPEEVLAQANEVMKARWLSILIQLTNSARFNKFLEDNYTIGDRIDHENKTIETLVVEKPISVGPPLEMKQFWQIRKAIDLSGTEKVDEVFNAIMKALGQEPPGLVTSATEADVRAAAAAKDELDA